MIGAAEPVDQRLRLFELAFLRLNQTILVGDEFFLPGNGGFGPAQIFLLPLRGLFRALEHFILTFQSLPNRAGFGLLLALAALEFIELPAGGVDEVIAAVALPGTAGRRGWRAGRTRPALAWRRWRQLRRRRGRPRVLRRWRRRRGLVAEDRRHRRRGRRHRWRRQ